VRTPSIVSFHKTNMMKLMLVVLSLLATAAVDSFSVCQHGIFSLRQRVTRCLSFRPRSLVTLLIAGGDDSSTEREERQHSANMARERTKDVVNTMADACKEVIQANNEKSQAVIKANNEITDIRITAIVDGFAELGKKIDSVKAEMAKGNNETNTKIDKLQNEVGDLKTFKSFAIAGWSIFGAVIGAVFALVLQAIGKSNGWL
jgi:soluble cytochrome b562